MHGQNINLPVCVCVCVCPSHFLLTCLQVRPLNGFLQLIASVALPMALYNYDYDYEKTWIYARMCLLEVSMMNNHI